MKLLIETKSSVITEELKLLIEDVQKICMSYFAEVCEVELKGRTLYLTINSTTEKFRLIKLIEELRRLAHSIDYENVIYSIGLDTVNIIEVTEFDAELIF